MPTRTQSPKGVLDIVQAFRNTLRAAMPTDARAYFALPADMPLHSEMFALLLKETWLVELFTQCYLSSAGLEAKMYRLRGKTSQLKRNWLTQRKK